MLFSPSWQTLARWPLAVFASALLVALVAGCNSKPGAGEAAVGGNAPPALALAGGDANELASPNRAVAQADSGRETATSAGNSAAADTSDAQNSAQQAGNTDEASKPDSTDPLAKLDEETKATVQLLQSNLKAWDSHQPYDFKPVAERISNRLQSDFSGTQVQIAAEAGQIFLQIGAYDQARQIYKALEKAAAQANNSKLSDGVKELIAPALAKLNLLGTKPKIDGTLLGGDKLDWSQYQGKVVLLDFWATWCGPCRAELPNVKKTYEKFHDQGFDVVGISLDDDKEKLTTFLDQEKLPWPILFSDDPAKQGWEGAAMTGEFGITAIPATFLLDRSGKLVSLSARGEELAAQVEKLLAEKPSRD